MTSRTVHAGFGVLSALVGVAAGHLVASLLEPAASPVLVVGSAVVDRTPTPMKEWAIRQFGTNDKAVLVGSVLLGVLVLAAVAGLLARRRFAYGAGLLVVLVAIPAWAAVARTGAAASDVVPSLVAALAGVGALAWLVRAAGAAQAPTPRGGRRGVLVAGGVLTAGGVAMAAAGRWITSYRTHLSDVELPVATDPAPPFPQGLEDRVPGISAFRTPTADFYRVDTRLSLPIVDPADWSLTIDGDVDQEVTFTFDDLLAMPLVERDITLTCVSNEVGGRYVGAARWLGVRLTDLLDRAGIDRTGADQILSTDVDGMTISTPLDLATDGRDAMIAVGMNGQSLTREHGFPARMVVPGLYGFVSACKWITRITLTTYAEQDAYWTERDWATDAPIKISSRIDTPEPLATIEPGRTVIGGIAWAQHQGGVAKVEVRVDGGRVAGGPARPVGGQRLLAPVVPALDRGARAAPARRPRDRRRGRRADRRAGRALPRGLERDPGDHRERRLIRPIRPAPPLRTTSEAPLRIDHNGRHHHEPHPPPYQRPRRPRPRRDLRSRRLQRRLELRRHRFRVDLVLDALRRHVLRHRPSDMSADDATDAAAQTFGAGCSAVPTDGQGLVRRHGDRPGRHRRQHQPAAQDPGHRRRRGRPGRHPELGRRHHRVRADRRRVRQDPGQGP